MDDEVVGTVDTAGTVGTAGMDILEFMHHTWDTD